MSNFHSKKLTHFQNKHRDQTCIVCGLGSSLADNWQDLKKQYITIGVNDINAIFRPDYHIISENIGDLIQQKRWESHKGKLETILNTRSRYVFSPYSKGYINKKPVYTELVDLRKDPIESAFPSNRLFAYRKVTTAAISLAMWMGFNRIGILGFDMKGDRAVNCSTNALNCAGSRLKEMNIYCDEIFFYAYRNEVEIYNLSDSTAITSFPIVSKERFKEIDNEYRSNFNRDCIAYRTNTIHNTSNTKISKYHLYDFKNKYDGSCLVCGTGDSLNNLTQDMVNTYPVIGVNGFVNAYVPDFEVVTDNIDINFDYDKKIGQSGLNTKARNIINNRAKFTISPNNLRLKHSNWVPVRLLSLKNYDVNVIFNQNYLCVYYSTIIVAISFAMYAGFKQIGILGFDLYKHHLSMYAKELNWGMERLLFYSRNIGVELINLSDHSMISSIPAASINDFDGWYRKYAYKKLD